MNTPHTDRYQSHEAVASLLPWYVNGTLADAERALVERHLEVCLRCRGALNAERRLASTVREVEVETVAARHAFKDLKLRLTRDEPPARARLAAMLTDTIGWLLRPAATACVVIAALLLTLPYVTPEHNAPGLDGEYRTLAAPRGNYELDAAHLRVVFAAAVASDARRAILDGAGARIVSGPSAHGVYTVAPAAESREPVDLLAALRTSKGVVFVEPVRRRAEDRIAAP